MVFVLVPHRLGAHGKSLEACQVTLKKLVFYVNTFALYIPLIQILVDCVLFTNPGLHLVSFSAALNYQSIYVLKMPCEKTSSSQSDILGKN